MSQFATSEGRAIDIERARVADSQSSPGDSFGWMTGLNFNPLTQMYQRGPIGGTGEVIDPATMHLPPLPNVEPLKTDTSKG